MWIRMPKILSTVFALSIAAACWAQGWPAARSASGPPGTDPAAGAETQDFGVPPPRGLHAGAMHAPTPASIPGGQVVTTRGLAGLVRGGEVPYLVFDVLGGPQTLPGAVPAAWMSQPGSWDDATQRQVEQALGQLAQGRKDVVLVFYCLSPECWMSYNAALRAIHAGYRNVLWYRGGIEAWMQAGLPTVAAAMGGSPSAGGPQAAGPGAGGAYPQQFLAQEPRSPQGTFPAAGAQFRPPAGGAPASARFTEVQPVMPGAGSRAMQPPAGGELRLGQTQFFSFAQPPGWRIGEEGQFALTQIAPDGRAYTLMVGNSGLPVNYPPERFAWEKFSAVQPQDLQFGQGRQAEPAAGFHHAIEFPVSYVAGGIRWRGLAKVSVAPAYDSATLTLVAALASQDQWDAYASWLPQVAALVSATSGAAFGRRGIMQQNLRNSVAFGQAAQQYRAWSQANWQGVVDQREASTARRNVEFREALGGVQTYANPHGQAPVELPTTNSYYWIDAQGRVLGTDDPGADPNVGSTADWRRMEPLRR